MKTLVVAGLVALMAAAGALSAFANDSRTVHTSVDLELEFWVSLANDTAFVSSRQLGEEWTTHDFAVPLTPYPGLPTLLVSEPVAFTLPVTVQAPAGAGVVPLTPLQPAPTPHAAAGEAPAGRATCCAVRGMWDDRAKQRAVAAEMRKVITKARTDLGLTHDGPITINIAYTPGGLLVRYRDAFGETLEELPDACSFQRGEHIFLAPSCRTDPDAIAREWIIRAVEAPWLAARWVGVATFEYYWHWYRHGEPPTVRDDRFRSAVFHEPATDFRQGRAHDDLMGAAALYAIESYGTFEDWLAFYEDVRGGSEVGAAFQAAFGVSLLRFHEDFEAWAAREQRDLVALAYGSCREAARYIVPRRAADGGGFPDFRVPLAYDDDGDGYVCEAYALFADDELICVVAGDTRP